MQVFVTRISQFNDLAGLELLDDNRKNKTLGYLNLDDKVRSLVAGLMLRYRFGDKLSSLKVTLEGKPYLQNGECFNLSHGGEYVVLAVDKFEIGVDVEPYAKRADEIEKKVCVKDELEWLAERGKNGFLRLWTGKESVMKACGKGFLMPPSSFSVAPPIDGEHVINGEKWYMNWIELPNHVLCVTSRNNEKIQVTELSRKQLLGE